MTLLFGIENPLLDISVVADAALLKKYNLKENDAILAGDEHKELYNDILGLNPSYLAGGACQNTLRGAQWMLPKDSTVYVGAVGDDEAAKVLQKEANKDGLRTAYQITNYPTGKCAVLINGVHRSMVTDLQAANQFSIDHLDKSEIWEFVTKANYYYIGGYFLTVSPPSAIKIAKHSVEKGKSLSLNLAAPFISQFFKDPLDELLEYTNVVFGNEAEAEAFSTSHGFGTVNVKEIAKKIAEFPKKFKGDRLVVLTQGADDTIVYYQGNVTSYPIKKIDPKDIVDCNGAGDAFVGGFLSQFVQGKSVTDSIRGGHYLAHVVIQRTGPSYPTTPHEFK